MREPSVHYYSSCRLQLSYCQWEKPEAPNLLLVHGGKDHNRNWDWLANQLGASFNIVAPDLRGHGESDWNPSGSYYFSEFVVDIANLVDHLGWTSFSIVAHSLGSALSLHYTAAFPEQVERIVTMEGLVPPPRILKEEALITTPSQRLRHYVGTTQKATRRRNRQFDSLEEALQRMMEQNPHFSRELAEHLTRHGIKTLDNGKLTWKSDPMMDLRLRFDIPPTQRDIMWRGIHCPILMIHGEESFAIHPLKDGTAALFDDVRIIDIGGASHWMHHDRPEEVLGHIRQFLHI